MKIDSHQHFWKYNKEEYKWIDNKMCILKNDFLPDDLQSQVKESEFDGTIAVQARQSVVETEWLLQLAQAFDFIKGVVGWVDLCSKNASDQLEIYSSNPNLIGVRHVIHDEPDDYFILRKDFIGGIRWLEKFNLTYDILIFARHLPQTIEFVKKFPNQVFVLDHIGKPPVRSGNLSPWKENLQEFAKNQNVYCKLSGMITEANWTNWTRDDVKPYLDSVVEAFGTKRLMIGSDWPVCLVAGNYNEVMGLVMDYFSEFSDVEKAAVFGNTAINAYHLKTGS